MAGNTLIPLNAMQTAQPKLYEDYTQKYAGREEVMRRTIPLLDCLWNDAVQFLPLHPQKVFELQHDMGLILEIPPYRFYQIPLELLDPEKTVVFFKTAAGEENTEVKWLNNVGFESLQTIPEATIDYYKSFVGSGELPFNYQFVPHLLYAGTVDISTSPIITLSSN